MAEELPDSPSDPSMSSDGMDGAEPRTRRLPLTWMILLPILVVAIGMLASDIFRGRIPQKAAFEKVYAKLMSQQSDDSGGFGGGIGGRRGGNQPPPLTAEAVHELLGRQPNLVEEKQLSGNMDDSMQPVMVETYKFPGIITSYSVVVTYLESAASENKPATTTLKYVRKE